jgi:hypothetical protein
MSVWPTASWTHVYTRRGRPRQWRKSVEASPPSWSAMWLGRPATTWWVTASAKSMELSHGPINTPYQWKSKHTPHFGNSTCKAPILSVVGRHSFVGRVERLWGTEGLPACREPSSSSSVEGLPEYFGVRQGFLALPCSSAEALLESYGFYNTHFLQ